MQAKNKKQLSISTKKVKKVVVVEVVFVNKMRIEWSSLGKSR